MTFPGSFYVQTVVAEPFAGANAKGDVFGAPQMVPCWVEEVSKLLASDTNEEVTAGTTGAFASSSTVYASTASKAAFLVGSRVTVPSGKVSKVLQVNTFDSGALGLGLDHLEIHLG